MRDQTETLEEKVARVVKEDVAVVPYDPRWPELFEEEKAHLLFCLPKTLIGHIEHFGSTAVPGLAAKPIVDMLVEVTSLDETRRDVPRILEPQGYDYFWRPTWETTRPPSTHGSSSAAHREREHTMSTWLKPTSSTGIDCSFVTTLSSIPMWHTSTGCSS